MRGFRKQVQHLANTLRLGVGEMKALPVETGPVSDMDHGAGDIIHRNHVDSSPFDPQRRHPGGQHAAQFLYQLEEIIGPVDLVDLAGLGVAHHDPRAVDAPRHAALVPHQSLGFMLGAEIGMVEVVSLLEHVLPKDALIETGSGNRTDVMETLDADIFSKAQSVLGALDVHRHLLVGIGHEVIHGRQVEHVVDLSCQLPALGGGHPQHRAGEVAGDRQHALALGAPTPAQLVELCA